MSVTGIVLAAGSSERMGRSKQDLPFGDTTLLGHVVAAAEASRLQDVIVVVAPGMRAPTARARAVVNEAPHNGTASSLLTGVAAAGAHPVMVLLADMPDVTTELIDLVLEAWKEDPKWAAVTRYTDGPGHPLVLSPYLTAALSGLSGDKALWPMLREADESEILFVTIGDPKPLDVNTREDYELACLVRGFQPG